MPKTKNWYAEADKAAKRYKLPTNVFRALIGAESGWNPAARSPVGAIGLGQLMPTTAAGLGVDPHNPVQNLDGAARYLSSQLDKFGKMNLALAAYNAGPGAVEKYGGVPPYKETQRYVRKIMSAAPTQQQAAVKHPSKQQPVTVPYTAPPSAALLGLAPGGTDLEQQAFQNLGRIGAGESPTRVLSQFVEQLAMQPAEMPKAKVPTKPVETTPVSTHATHTPGVPASVATRPGGGWGGSFNIAKALADMGVANNLKSVSEKRDRKATSSGGVSDHWTGSRDSYAFDLSNGGAPTPEMDAAARQIAHQLGVDYNGKDELVLTTRQNGYRIQVLYRTQVGGNHNNHIHVGVRKL